MKKKFPIILISIIFSIILWGTISLSELYYSNIFIPLRIVDLPEGYTTATDLPKEITIKLKGEGWNLFSLNIGKDVTYNVSVNEDSGLIDIKLSDYLSDNGWVLSEFDIIDIIPGSISCLIDRKIEKKIRVVADLHLDFKAGYGLAKQVELLPDSVIVNGPRSIISSLKELKTKKIKLSSLNKKIVKNIGFTELPGSVFLTKFVSVTFDVQRIVDKQFDDIIVKVLNVPPDRDVVLLPNKIALGVRGGIDILGKLKNEQFETFISYRDVVLDTLGNVIPKIKLPDNTNLVYIKPERLRYVIKKYR